MDDIFNIHQSLTLGANDITRIFKFRAGERPGDDSLFKVMDSIHKSVLIPVIYGALSVNISIIMQVNGRVEVVLSV